MWTLHYAPQVVSELYRLRQEGAQLREALKQLEQDPHPSDARSIPNRPDIFEIEVMGYWVLYHLQETEQHVRILNIEAVD